MCLATDGALGLCQLSGPTSQFDHKGNPPMFALF